MEEVKQDVNTEESSTPEVVEEEVVNEAVSDQQPEAQPEPAQPVPDSNQDLYDENGVPWKNRAMEYRRKTEDLVEKLPTLLEEAINKKTGEPKYTRQQLEAFKEQYADNAQYSTWAKDELRKLDREEQQNDIRAELNRFKTDQENNQKRQQANSYTVNQYPDAFLRGGNGQFVVDKNGDPVPNFQHPMGQAMASYLQDSGLQSRPDRMFIASKLAYADYVTTTQGKAMKQQQKLKEEVGSLQRKTMVEGSGKSSPQTTPAHVKALERLRQTGKVEDAKVALDALLKSRQKE
jgi:hypothetical protein